MFRLVRRQIKMILLLFIQLCVKIYYHYCHHMINNTHKIILCLTLIPIMLSLYRTTDQDYLSKALPIFVPKVNNMCYDPYAYITHTINNKKTNDTLYENNCVLKDHTYHVPYLSSALNYTISYTAPDTSISHVVIKKFTTNNFYHNACCINLFLIIVSMIYRMIKKPSVKINNLVTCFSILYVVFMRFVLVVAIGAGIYKVAMLVTVSSCFSMHYYPIILSALTVISTTLLTYLNIII